MQPHQLENLIMETADRVLARQPIEDSRIELKSKWLDDHHDAARQLAGLANASRGEPVIWIIGIDEKSHQIVGASDVELSRWWAQVESKFESTAPTMVLNRAPQHSSGVALVGLLFDASGRPFVVNNPKGGQITYEVPWRSGNSTRSAKRSDLIRILSPLSAVPRVDLLDATLSATAEATSAGRASDRKFLFAVSATVYITPYYDSAITIPIHLVSETAKIYTSHCDAESVELKVTAIRGRPFDNNPNDTNITEVHFDFPGRMAIHSRYTIVADVGKFELLDPVDVEICIGFAQIEGLHKVVRLTFKARQQSVYQLDRFQVI